MAAAPSPAASGTSFDVTAGTGAWLPAVPFQMTLWAVAAAPSLGVAEIVTVTGRATDTLTIVRAREGTTARAVAIGWAAAATITTKTLNELDGDRAPAGDVGLVADHTRVVVRRLRIASGAKYRVAAGAALRVL